MTIEKLMKGGEVVCPATVTTAVIDPNSKMTLQELLAIAIPLETSEVIDNEVIEVGKETAVNYTFVTRWRGVDVTPLCSYTVEGTPINGKTYTKTYNPSALGDITITVKTTYQGMETTDKFTVRASYPSYYGGLSGTTTPTEAQVKGLTEQLIGFKGFYVEGVNLNNERFMYAYPAELGDLVSIKDANGFQMLCADEECSSFKKTTVNINSIPYNVYTLETPCTVKSFRFNCR